jgi:hypothetical protein
MNRIIKLTTICEQYSQIDAELIKYRLAAAGWKYGALNADTGVYAMVSILHMDAKVVKDLVIHNKELFNWLVNAVAK